MRFDICDFPFGIRSFVIEQPVLVVKSLIVWSHLRGASQAELDMFFKNAAIHHHQ